MALVCLRQRLSVSVPVPVPLPVSVPWSVPVPLSVSVSVPVPVLMGGHCTVCSLKEERVAGRAPDMVAATH